MRRLNMMKLRPMHRPEPPWAPEYKEPARRPKDRALVVSDGKRAKTLAHIGPGLDYLIDECGEVDTFYGLPAGIWVVQVVVMTYETYDGEYDLEVETEERSLTSHEWEMFEEGHDDGPWRQSDWLKNPISQYPKKGPSDLPPGWGPRE